MENAILTNLPIILSLVIGIGLLVVEAFMPGFGVAGFSGIALELVAVVMTYLRHGALAAVVMMLVCLSVVAVAIALSLRSAAKGKLSRSEMILRETESDEAGYRATEDMQVFLGKEGVSVTVLRPTGMAEFDGVKLNVMSEGDFINPGVQVKIVKVDGSRVIVKPL